MEIVSNVAHQTDRKEAMIVATKGPKDTKVGDVVEAEGALWIVSRIQEKQMTAERLLNGQLKHPRTFRTRQVAGVWRRIGTHRGRG